MMRSIRQVFMVFGLGLLIIGSWSAGKPPFDEVLPDESKEVKLKGRCASSLVDLTPPDLKRRLEGARLTSVGSVEVQEVLQDDHVMRTSSPMFKAVDASGDLFGVRTTCQGTCQGSFCGVFGCNVQVSADGVNCDGCNCKEDVPGVTCPQCTCTKTSEFIPNSGDEN